MSTPIKSPVEVPIEYVPIGDLHPYEWNAKLHPEEQIERIAESIRQFGFNDPIAVWKDNVVIEGHGRLLAAKKLGLAEVPVMRLENLSDEQRRAYTLVHNKLTMNSGYDFGLVDSEAAEINLDLSAFGVVDYDDLVDDIFKDEPPADDPEKPKERVVICPHCNSEVHLK